MIPFFLSYFFSSETEPSMMMVMTIIEPDSSNPIRCMHSSQSSKGRLHENDFYDMCTTDSSVVHKYLQQYL
jgi:hypothetical protein